MWKINFEQPQTEIFVEYFTIENLTQWYQTAQELYKFLHVSDQNRSEQTDYNRSEIQIFDWYTAFYNPDHGKAKTLFPLLKNAWYGIAITTENGIPHTHQQSHAINIILNPKKPQEISWFLAGDSHFYERWLLEHGKILTHGTVIDIPRNYPHGHIVAQQCQQYRISHSQTFPLAELLISYTKSTEVSFFFLQLCDFNNKTLVCHNDFHIIADQSYYHQLYTQIYYELLCKHKQNILAEKNLLSLLSKNME
jgi:hypothetical protein